MKTSLYLARLFGLYMVVIALVMLVNGDGFRARMAVYIEDPGLMVLGGFLSLVLGLAIIAGHSVLEASWRAVITVIGYLSALKGIVLLAWPDQLLRMSKALLETNFTLPYALVVGPLGAWLAWIGFRTPLPSGDDDSPSLPANV